MPYDGTVHSRRLDFPHQALRGGHYCDVKQITYQVVLLDQERQVWTCPGCGVEVPGAEYAHRLRVPAKEGV